VFLLCSTAYGVWKVGQFLPSARAHSTDSIYATI
jgi:hypothetical protein